MKPTATNSFPQRAFWFLRHGETDWNAEGRSQGGTDIPLNATGVAQAKAAASQLRGRGIASIVSSPLSRALDTARAVGDALALPVTVIADLAEVSFGGYEGHILGPTWISEWTQGLAQAPGGESFAELRTRAVTTLNEALAFPPPVLVVAHGVLFRALRAEMGLPADVRLANALPLFCQPGNPWTLTPAD